MGSDYNMYIKKDSKFLKLNNDVSFERLKSLLNKYVYVDIYDESADGVISYYFKLASVEENNIIFKSDDIVLNVNISNIRSIEEIISYNNINFNKYIGKNVLLTDLYDNKEYVFIDDVDNLDVILRFNFEDKNSIIYETKDYSFPKCFIKNIDLA